MHYLPFGARLNKGILMVTQLNQGFSHFLPLYFIVNFYRCQRPTRWIRTIEIDNQGRISDFHSPILPFFRIQKY